MQHFRDTDTDGCKVPLSHIKSDRAENQTTQLPALNLLRPKALLYPDIRGWTSHDRASCTPELPEKACHGSGIQINPDDLGCLADSSVFRPCTASVAAEQLEGESLARWGVAARALNLKREETASTRQRLANASNEIGGEIEHTELGGRA